MRQSQRPLDSEGLAPLASANVQVNFFEKLAKLEHTVRAGDHPYLKLAKQDVALPGSTNNVKGNAVDTAPPALGDSDATPSANFKPFSLTRQGPAAAPKSLTNSSSSRPHALGQSQESTLEKVRLRRELIEKALEDAVTRRKEYGRNNFGSGFPLDGSNDIHASQILDAATEITKPKPQLNPAQADNDQSSNRTSSLSDSVFYSSKVDSLSQDGSHQSSQAHLAVENVSDKSGQGKDKELKPSDIAEAQEGHSAPGSPLELDANHPPPSRGHRPSPPRVEPDEPRDEVPLKELSMVPNGAEPEQRRRESESYSPPSPPAPLLQNRPPALATQQHPPEGSSPTSNRFQVSIQTTSQDPMHLPPSNKGTQRKNHTSGSRPGESRAKAKNNDQAPANTELAAQPSRKRRREIDQTDSRRDLSGKRTRIRQSPEPNVKLEPESPPPLTTRPQATRSQATRPQLADSPPRALRMRDDGTAELRSRPEQHDLSSNIGKADQPRAFEPRSGNAQVGGPAAQTQRSVDRRNVSSPSVMQEQVTGQVGSRRFTSARPSFGRLSFDHQRPIYIDDEEPLNGPSPRFVSRRPEFQAMTPYYESGDPWAFYERRTDQYAVPVDQNEGHFRRRLDDPELMPPPPSRKIIVDGQGNEWVAVPARRSVRSSLAREMPLDETRALPTFSSPAQFTEEPSRRRPEPQVIDLENDDRYARMAPPPPPIYRERAFPALCNGHEVLMPQQRSRAASAMPNPLREDSRYAHIPNTPTFVTRDELDRPRDRAYSARPPNAAQPAYASTRWAEFGPRANQW